MTLPTTSSIGEHLVLDPLLVREQVAVGLRQDDPNAIGQRQTGVLAHRVQLVREVVDAALAPQLLVELGRQGDGQRIGFGEHPALAGASLDEDLVRPELASVDANAAAFQLLELTRLQRCAYGAELLAELRSEHGQVRLDAQLGRFDGSELDLLHAQLLRDLVGMTLRLLRTLHDDAA